MKFTKTKLKGVVVVEPAAYGDNRGWFMETYNHNEFKANGLDYNFVQDNQSFSAIKGTIRGLHYQKNPSCQAKLVRCTQGVILDFAVDMRKGSDTYLQHVAVELSAENKKQLLVPHGFAHGFSTLTPDVMVQYKVDNFYSKDHEQGIAYNDPQLGLDWQAENPTLSAKDLLNPQIKDLATDFTIKVLVTGVKGQLGNDVVIKLESEGYEVKGADINDFDITDYDMTSSFIKNYNPDVVVHCSAYTAVDKAESEQELCRKVNAVGSENIAKVCAEIDAKMVYISTDYVFDGQGDKPFEVDSKTAPLSVYGKTKLEGEHLCKKHLDKLFIVRTSWVFGKNGNNFVKTMLRLAEERDTLGVVSDQVGSPTYTVDLSNFIFYIINTNKFGTYLCSNEGFCSWHEFASEIFNLAGKKVTVNKVATADYKTAAVRPLNSRMSKAEVKKSGFGTMPTWQDALKRYLEEIKE